MRTNIDIDDKLMAQAMKATGAATKRAAVEAALRRVIELKAQEGIRRWRGKIEWDGDLAAMRTSRYVNKSGIFDHEGDREKTKPARGRLTQQRRTA